MTKDEALREAIDTLKSTKHGNCDFAWIDETLKKCTEALAQPPLPAQEQQQARVDVITVNLMREGIDKHRARELADHFVNFTLTPPLPVQPEPLEYWNAVEGWVKIESQGELK